MAKEPERVVHLALSQDAAKLVDQILEYAYYSMDGCVMDHVEYGRDPDEIVKAVRGDIAEQVASKPKKKTTTTKRSKKR